MTKTTPATFAATVYARVVERMQTLNETYERAVQMAGLEFSVGAACWDHVDALHREAMAAAPSVELINGAPYVSAVRRGVSYCLHRHGDGWGVSSRRLALGRSNVGGFKPYATLSDVAEGCAAFGSAAALVALLFKVPPAGQLG